MKKIIILAFSFVLLNANAALAELSDTHNASASIHIDLPITQVWDQLQDFSVAHNYVPDITKTTIVSALKKGVGAHRHVYDSSGDRIDETIIEWYEGRGFLLRIHDGDEALSPFTMSQFLYQLQAEGDGTRVVLTLSYQMPWGFVGEKLNDWVISDIALGNVAKTAAGMKYFYETGKAATDQHRTNLLNQVTTSKK